MNRYSVILRSPRLAIVGTNPRTIETVVDGLAEYLSSWDIATHVYMYPDAAPSAAQAPDGLRTLSRLAGLITHSWQPISAAEAANGGDLTLLVLSPAASLRDLVQAELELARAMSTPVVIAASPGEVAELDPDSFAGGADGIVVTEPGALRYHPIAHPRQPIRADALVSARAVQPGTDALPQIGSLLVLGHRAPALVPADGFADRQAPGQPGQPDPVPAKPGPGRSGHFGRSRRQRARAGECS